MVVIESPGVASNITCILSCSESKIPAGLVLRGAGYGQRNSMNLLQKLEHASLLRRSLRIEELGLSYMSRRWSVLRKVVGLTQKNGQSNRDVMFNIFTRPGRSIDSQSFFGKGDTIVANGERSYPGFGCRSVLDEQNLTCFNYRK